MKIEEFLVKAKTQTYAVGAAERSLVDGDKELTFEEDGWRYRDRYFGSRAFVGEELVWQNDKLVWAMNYAGRILKETADDQQIVGFLRQALRVVGVDRPYRGPATLQDGDWRYENESVGYVGAFAGRETIRYKEEVVYELDYHGGYVS
jgi:hypothetical protein